MERMDLQVVVLIQTAGAAAAAAATMVAAADPIAEEALVAVAVRHLLVGLRVEQPRQVFEAVMDK
jgi:hypothetical protein